MWYFAGLCKCALTFLNLCAGVINDIHENRVPYNQKKHRPPACLRNLQMSEKPFTYLITMALWYLSGAIFRVLNFRTIHSCGSSYVAIFAALNTHLTQIVMCLTFIGEVTHENLTPTKCV